MSMIRNMKAVEYMRISLLLLVIYDSKYEMWIL